MMYESLSEMTSPILEREKEKGAKRGTDEERRVSGRLA